MFLNKRHLCLSKKTFRFSFTLSFFIKKVSKIRRFKISDFRRPTRKILRKNLKWISRVIFKSKYRSKYRSKYNPKYNSKELPQKKKLFWISRRKKVLSYLSTTNRYYSNLYKPFLRKRLFRPSYGNRRFSYYLRFFTKPFFKVLEANSHLLKKLPKKNSQKS
jgi:hypothetical protein